MTSSPPAPRLRRTALLALAAAVAVSVAWTLPRPPQPEPLRSRVAPTAVDAGAEAGPSIVLPAPAAVDTPVDLRSRPAFTPRTQEPRLPDDQRRVLMAYLEDHYPAELRERGTGARVILWIFIDEEGRVGNSRLVESSGNEKFDAVADSALRSIRFEPARNGDERVPVWVQLPVAYQTKAEAPARPSAANVGERPSFTPRTQEPVLANREALTRTIQTRSAPLREEGISGRAILWVFIDAEGAVGNARIVESAGDERLDSLAVEIIRTARFEPALNRGERVPVWIQLPLSFRPAGETASR